MNRKIFDAFLFFNELELLEIRLHTLAHTVDYFVITEATRTFSGKPKEMLFAKNRAKFDKFEHKIIYNPIDCEPNWDSTRHTRQRYYTGLHQVLQHKSNGKPLSSLSADFQREVFQRDSIVEGLINRATPEDLVIISDLDEIPNPNEVERLKFNYRNEGIVTFRQKWHMYYLNVVSKSDWFGSRVCEFGHLEGRSVDQMRFHLEDRKKQPGPIIEDGGWHFSFLGGATRIKEKLEAYSYQGRRSRIVLSALDRLFPNRIMQKIDRNLDIFNTGRVFKITELDSTYPSYISQNLEKFGHLIKK